MKIIDTHQHLWDVDVFKYSWLESIPALHRSFGLKDYREATRDLEIEKSVFVECDVAEPSIPEETRHFLRLADQPDNPVQGVVAAARPEKEGFKVYIEAIAGHPKLKGIRRILHTQPDELGRGKLFIENVQSLAGYGLSFDICVLARQLPVAIDLVSKCPGVNFILDHCGVPEVKDKSLDPWRQHILKISKMPNVTCKISGLVAYADPAAWTAEDLRPYVEHVVESFGWDRVMFGSDWPVCTLAASYKQWVEALLSLTASAGEANQKKLFHENATRVYRLS